MPKTILKADLGVRGEFSNTVLESNVLEKIANGEIIGRRIHPNTEKYPNQQIFVLEINGYVWYVPFVETEDEIFLKTIIPSRKLTKEFGGKKNEK